MNLNYSGVVAVIFLYSGCIIQMACRALAMRTENTVPAICNNYL